MRSESHAAHAAVDSEHVELRLLPGDPPASVDLLLEERLLPYDLGGPKLSAALVRVVERFGLPERPLVAAREDAEDGDDGDYQVLNGGFWIRAAREAGMDRVPVRALEVTDLPAAFLALVLNQPRAADVAAQADALQALLESGVDPDDLARISGLGRGRLRRLEALLELHPVLRQALREGRLAPQVAFGAAGLSEASQQDLAAVYEREGEVTGADLKQLGGGAEQAAAETDDDGEVAAALAALQAAAAGRPAGAGGLPEDAAVRARRQAEELLRTLEEASISGEIRERVAEVVQELSRMAAPVP